MFLGRVVGPGDPVWLPADREKALWWVRHDAERCRVCGFPRRVFDPEMGGDPHAMEWKATHCRGCEILGQGEEWLTKNRADLRRGTSVRMVPTPLVVERVEQGEVGSDAVVAGGVVRAAAEQPG